MAIELTPELTILVSLLDIDRYSYPKPLLITSLVFN
jgi:hypothetical protein